MESLTYQKNLKISPKKMRMIRDDVARMTPHEALDFLYYSPLKSARMYYKVLRSAISNATNTLKVQPDMLQFKLLTIEEGRRLKRFKAGSKGMAKPIVREYCHVKVILVEKEVTQSKKTKVQSTRETKDAVKEEKKPAAKKAESKKVVQKETKTAESKQPAESKNVTKSSKETK